jgi:predicted nucleic acid-binding protein
MVIVDTTVWVNYLNGVSTLETAWLDVELDRQRIGLTDLILCEILQGLSSEREADRVAQALAKFEIFSTGGVLLATRAASNYRALRAKGVTVRRPIDCLIASFCIENGHALLHEDHDFDGCETYLRLQVIHPG